MTSDPMKPADAPQNIGVSGASDQPSPEAVLASCGDFDMRIGRDGTWHYRGSPITRKPLVKLFSSVLRRDEAGDYWLVTPVERGRITVEDAPFTAVEVEARGEGAEQVLSFRNNVDDWIEAGQENPIRVIENPETGEPSPYILVRDNLEARIVRPVYYQMVEQAIERRIDGEVHLGLWSKNTFFSLGKLP